MRGATLFLPVADRETPQERKGPFNTVCLAPDPVPGPMGLLARFRQGGRDPQGCCQQVTCLPFAVLLGTIFSVLLVAIILMAFCVYKPIRRR